MSEPARIDAEAANYQSSTLTQDNFPTARRFYLPFNTLNIICGVADSFTVICASLLGGIGYQFVTVDSLGRLEQYIAAGTVSALLFALSMRASGAYQLSHILSGHKSRRDLLQNWLLVALLLTLLAFLLKIGHSYSRGSTISFACLAPILLIAERAALRRFIAVAMAKGWLEGKRAILLGSREELAALDASTMLHKFGLTEVARIEIAAEKSSGFSLSTAAHAMMQVVLETGRRECATDIVLALAWSETRQIELFREALRASPLSVQLLPDRRIRNLASNPSFQVKSSLALEVQRAPLSPVEQFLKRLVDIFGASLALLLLSPVMLVAAIAIKLDTPGPILFRQRRNGFNARQFVIYKFRSMRVFEDGNDVRQAKRVDQRVTAVGRVLRRSSIDELPQLLNVLKGDMSLIGPRPHALAHDSHYGQIVGDYAFRHHVKPGITGWAQVNGYRGETARVEQMQQRVAHDLWYISNWSLMLDLRIMARTCFEVVRSRNAY